MMEKDKWIKLNNSPIVLAILQIQFELPENYDVKNFLINEKIIKKELPFRRDDFSGNINLPSIPVVGISTAQISSAILGFSFINKDTQRMISISRNSFIYSSEAKYEGWEDYKKEGLKYFSLFSNILSSINLSRLSVRFVNKINLPVDDNLLNYFKITISAQEGAVKYPTNFFSLKFSNSIPDTKIATNVGLSLEERNHESLGYVFDIDVLDHEIRKYDLDIISESFDKLREIKNDIFFSCTTDKTISML